MSVGLPDRPVTWADVNKDVERTVSMPGNLYFGWMCIVALTPVSYTHLTLPTILRV